MEYYFFTPQLPSPQHVHFTTRKKTMSQMNALIAAGIISARDTPERTGFKSIPAGMEARANPAVHAAMSVNFPITNNAPPTIMRPGRMNAQRAPTGSSGPRPSAVIARNGSRVM